VALILATSARRGIPVKGELRRIVRVMLIQALELSL
jgi:hypothetical protein